MFGGIGHFIGSGLVLPPSLFGGGGSEELNAFEDTAFESTAFE